MEKILIGDRLTGLRIIIDTKNISKARLHPHAVEIYPLFANAFIDVI